MSRWCVALVCSGLLVVAAPAWGRVRRVSEAELGSGQVRVNVPSGYGVAISLHGLPERLQQVFLGDPTEIVVQLDRPVPQTRVVYLRRVQPGALPLQTRSGGRGTVLTLVTERRVFQVEVVPGGGGDTLIEVVSGGSADGALIERGIAAAVAQGRLSADSPLIPRLRQFAENQRRGLPEAQNLAQVGLTEATIRQIQALGREQGTILDKLKKR